MLPLTARAKCPLCGEIVYKEVSDRTERVTFQCWQRDVDSVNPRSIGCRKRFTGLVSPAVRVKVGAIRKIKEG